MNTIKQPILSALTALLFMAANSENPAFAQTITQPVTLTPIYNSPPNAPITALGDQYTISATSDVNLWIVSWDYTAALSLQPFATLSNSIISIACPGNVALNLGKCHNGANIQFMPDNANGTISMNPQVQLGLHVQLSFNGSGPIGTINENPTWRLNGPTFQVNTLSSFDCYGFAPRTLTSTVTKQLYSENILKDLVNAICEVESGGNCYPSWLGGINLNVNADFTLSQTVSALGISTSAGNEAVCEQPIYLSTPPDCFYLLGNIAANWNDSITVDEGLTMNVSVNILSIFTWSTPQTGLPDLLSQTTTFNLNSAPVGTMFFQFTNYTVTTVQAPNGTIYPSSPSPQTVCEGKCLTFTDAPTNGYHLCEWIVDGVPQSAYPISQFSTAGQTFTLSDIQANHTVTASFCGNQYIAGGPIFTLNTNILRLLNGVSSVVLYGGINPNGTNGWAWFRWGNADAITNTTTPIDYGGTDNNVFTNLLTGLLPNTLYSFILVASNSSSYVESAVQSFTTIPLPPTVSTGAVSFVSATSVILNGSVNPEGTPTTAWFRWGISTNYGNLAPSPAYVFASDTSGDAFAALLTNLHPATVYHYQLFGTNSSGLAYTSDQVFRTIGALPTTTILITTNVSSDAAIISGYVNPGGLNTLAWFNWGTTSNYGNTTPSPVIACGNGNTSVGVASLLGPLNAKCAYHVQLVASNAAGMISSADELFTTVGPQTPIISLPVLLPMGGGVELLVAGSYGTVYALQTSTNLLTPANWATLSVFTMTNNVQTIYDTTPVSLSSQRYYRVIFFGQDSSCMAHPSGLVLWWPGDGNANDIVGTNNGALNSGVGFASGMVGQAVLLDGISGYVHVPAANSLDPTQGATLSAWVYFDRLPSVVGHIMTIIGKSGFATDLDLQAETDNRFHFYVANSQSVVSATVIQPGIWYHVAGTYSAQTSVVLYVNGIQEGLTPINVTRSANGNPLEIGNSWFWAGRYFSGRIDEATLYDRPLTNAEIQGIYSAGSAGMCKPN